jgi:hypothetical protein
MNSIQMNLWEQNYRGEGMCSELEKVLKKLDYGSRKGVSYLPWAVVERIFKLQGGGYELLRDGDGHTVEIEKSELRKEYDDLGNETVIENLAYFINVKVYWLGLTHVERYPLQNSSGMPLKMWNQNDINKAAQRAKVKAIANISGIGYKLFEDGDLQFEEDENEQKEKKDPEEKSAKKEALKKKFEQATKKKKPQKTNDNEISPAAADVSKDDENENAKEPQTAKPKKDIKEVRAAMKEKSKDESDEKIKIPEDKELTRAEMEKEIKHRYVSGGPKKEKAIKEYLVKTDSLKISKLNDDQLKEVYAIAVS